MYFDTKIWLYHCIYPQPNYGKLLSQRFDIFFIIIDERKHGGILKMLTTFLAVVIGFGNIASKFTLPLTIWLVLLKIFQFPHISECSSQPMRILHISTANVHILNCLYSDLLRGLNNMASRHLQMRRLTPFLMNNGHSTSKSWQLLLDSHFRVSNTFNNGFLQKRFFIMGIMSKQNWRFFVHICIFKGLGIHGTILICSADYLWHMNEAQKTIERSIPLRIQTKYKWAINTKSDLPYGFVFLRRRNNSRKAVPWFLTFEADMEDYFRLQLAPLIPCYYNFGPKPWVNWPYLRFGKLFTASYLIQPWYQPSRSQWWPSWLLQFSTTRSTPWCSQFTDFGMGNIATQTLSFRLTCHKGVIHSNFPMLVRFTRPQEDQGDLSGRYFHNCTGIVVCHIFQAVNVIWQQIRGAGIGSQISPSLSNLAVTIVETLLDPSFKEVIDPPAFPFLAIRYVDNRYILFPEDKKHEPAIQVLSQDDFINIQFELEEVTTNELLGFCGWFQPPYCDIITSRTVANSSFCICRQYSPQTLVYNHDATSFPAILFQVRKVQIEFTHWFYFMSQRLLNPDCYRAIRKSKKGL